MIKSLLKLLYVNWLITTRRANTDMGNFRVRSQEEIFGQNPGNTHFLLSGKNRVLPGFCLVFLLQKFPRCLPA